MGKKSKKVIARVMAVLMAFSLLPFDFWGTASVVRAEELSEKYVEAEASSTAETAIAETDTAEADEESSSAANSESEEPTEQDSAVSEDVETEEEEETDSAKVEDVETAGDEKEEIAQTETEDKAEESVLYAVDSETGLTIIDASTGPIEHFFSGTSAMNTPDTKYFSGVGSGGKASASAINYNNKEISGTYGMKVASSTAFTFVTGVESTVMLVYSNRTANNGGLAIYKDSETTATLQTKEATSGETVAIGFTGVLEKPGKYTIKRVGKEMYLFYIAIIPKEDNTPKASFTESGAPTLTSSNTAEGVLNPGDVLTLSYTLAELGDDSDESTIEWFRVKGDAEESLTPDADSGNKKYTITDADIDSKIKVKVTPKTSTLGAGTYAETSLDIIVTEKQLGFEELPEFTSTGNPETPFIGDTLTVNFTAAADETRTPVIEWYRVGDNNSETKLTADTNSNDKSYTLVQADKDSKIKVVVTFKDESGENSITEECVTEAAVTDKVFGFKTSPSLTSDSVDDSVLYPGETLTLEYELNETGTDASEIKWERVKNENGTETTTELTANANSDNKQYTVQKEDAGSKIKVTVTPKIGDSSGDAKSDETIIVTAKTVKFKTNPSLSISAGGSMLYPEPKKVLTVKYELDTEETDASVIEWYRVSENGTETKLTADTDSDGKNYTIVAADEGNTIKVKVTPMINDKYAEEGEPKEASTTGVVVEEGFVPPVRYNMHLKADDLTADTYTETFSKNGFTINAAADEENVKKSVTIDGNKKSFNNVSYTQRIKTGGAGTKDYRSINFNVYDDAKIVIVGMSGNGSIQSYLGIAVLQGNELVEYKGNYSLSDGTNSSTSEYKSGGIPIKGDKLYGVTLDAVAGGTYYLYTTETKDENVTTIPGINVYGIDVTYTDGEEPTTYTVTFDAKGGAAVNSQTVQSGEACTEPVSYKDGYDLAGWCTDSACTQDYNFSEAVTANITLYAKWVESTQQGENLVVDMKDLPVMNYSAKFTKNNFTFNASSSKGLSVAKSSATIGEKNYTQVLKLNGTGDAKNNDRSISFTIDTPATLTVVAASASSGTARQLGVNKDGCAATPAHTIGSAADGTIDAAAEYTIELDAGTWYVYSLKDGINIYYISVKTEEGSVSAPTATPEPGAVEAGTEITLAAEEGAVIYYTLDGSEPIVEEADLEGKATKTYDEETTKITIDKATTINAVAVKEGVSSLVAVLAYTIKPSDGPDTSEKATIWVVGDSTVSAFNDTYYIPRQGYGTEIATYFNADVHNLAHSGASSKDFTTMSEYAVLKNGSDSVPKLGEADTEGKFLIIGFGHNDQKNETARYTNPNGDYKTEGSFAKSLYDNYIKLAIDAGVTPVVVTPIVRINEKNEYNNSSGHITNDEDGYPGGDYAEAIRKLCAEEEIKDKVILVDLTTVTRDMSVELGYDEVKWMHAFTAGEWADAEKKEIKPTESSVDKTHTNSYGAKMNAWLIGDLTKGTALEKHWRNKAKPSYDADFAATINDKYVPIDYTPADNETLKNSGWPVYTDADGREWYGTAFGDTGGQGKITKTEEDGTTHLHHDNFNAIIGEDNSLNLSVSGNAGKFAATTEGFIFYYTRLKAGSNFTLSAKAKVNSFNANNQVSYGLMARDEVYINEYISATMGDFVAAGTLNQGKYNGFGRKSGARFYGDNPVDAVHTYITAGDAPELKIVGTSDGFSMTYGENPTVSAGFDYPLTGVDSEYIYVGFYVARNADVTFSDIHLETDGAVTPPTPATIDPPEPDWADGTEFPSTGGKVTLTAAEGVDIYYTTSETAEGLTDPTVESTKYAEAIDVTKEIYIRAVAIKGDDKSDYLNLHYTVLPEGAVVKPSAHPGSETEVTEVAKDTVVYLATTDTDVESIYYTMGSEPADPKDENSGRQLYDKETGIVITEDTTIKAVAWKGGSYSEVATFVYKISTGGSEGPGEDDKQTLKQPEAVVAPAAVNGVVERNAKISLDAEEGAAIYYTTDGTDPTVEKGKLYKDAIVVTDDIIRDNTVTIKAIAVKEGFNNSSVATFAYSVSAQSAGDTEDPKIPANPADKDTAISVNSSKIQVKAANFVENKKPQYAVTVTYTHTDKDGKTYQEQLTEGVHYTVAVVGDKQPITAGEYQLTITGTSEGKEEPVKTDLGIFVGRKTVSYSIVGKTSTIAKDKTKNIAKAKFTLNKTDVKNAVYTGTYITPRVVPDSKNTISEENYIIVYKNNVNVGKASVTIVGTGEYYGSKTLTFSIKKGDISKVSIEASNLEVSGSGKARTANTEKIDGALTYKGSAITLQNPVLKLDDVLLNPRTDYSITYKNNAKAGDATATIKGINNLSGTITVKYKIKTVDGAELKSGLAEYDDTNPLPAEYSSKGARLTSITVSGVTLKEGTDYKVNYKGCSASAIDSTGKVKITGAGSYKNVFKDVTVSIKTVAGKYHIKDGLTVDTAKFKKNGKIDTKKLINAAKITDAAGVKVKDTEVIAFTEEDVTNTSIKVTPKTEGNFETTVLSCHVAAKLNSVKQSKNLADKYFDGVNTVTLTTTEIAEVLPGVEASDISIASYKNNNKIGSATVTIEGRPESAFYGTKNLKFKIVAAKPNLGTGAEEAPDEEEPGKLLDVWDFAGGATQIDDSGKPTEYLSEKKYNNRLTEEIMNTWYGEGVEAGSAGNNLSSFQVTNDEGVVVFEFNGNGKTNNRIRTKNTNITRFDSNSKKDADGNEYLGFVYSNSSSTSDVYLGILLEEGDIVNAVVGSNGGDSLIKFVPVDGSADAQSYEFKAGGANASIATFYAPKAGAYKMYSENEKLVVARVTVEKMESVTVSGQVTAPASLTTPYSVAFTCKETGAVKNAPVENGGYTIGLKEGYTYDVALADANGYIITNENPSITLPVGQSEFAYDISIASVDLVTVTGSIKGLAAVAGGVENPLANLKLTFKSDNIYVPEFTMSEAGEFTLVLEKGVAYAVTAEGVDDFTLETTTISAAESVTADITFAAKPVYDVTIAPEGVTAEELATTKFIFSRVYVEESVKQYEEGYAYTFTGTEGIKLRDGQYEIKAEGPYTQTLTSDLKVEGAAVTKAIKFSKEPVTLWDFADENFTDVTNFKGLLMSGIQKNKTYALGGTAGELKVPVAGPCTVTASYCYNATGSIEGSVDISLVQGVDDAYGSTSKEKSSSYNYTGGEGYVTITTTATTYLTKIAVEYASDKAEYKATVTVGASGCDYTTINDALDTVRKMTREDGQRVTIEIQPGDYEEMLVIDTPNVTLKNANANPSIQPINKGVDIDASSVRVTSYYGHGYAYYSMGSDCKWNADILAVNKANGCLSFENPGTGTTSGSYWNATVVIGADGFEADGIIFENSFNQYVSKKAADDVIVPLSGAKGENVKARNSLEAGDTSVQYKDYVERAAALAIMNGYKQINFNNCSFIGRQDTLYGGTDVTAAFYDCDIYGGTDYIFGGMTAVFAKCDLVFNTNDQTDNAKNDVGYITAAQTAKDTRGYLMYNCTVTSTTPGVNTASTKVSKPGYFGRPWAANTAEALFYKTIIGKTDYNGTEESLIVAAGWTDSLSGKSGLSQEYASIELAGVDNSSKRADWSNVLKADESGNVALADGKTTVTDDTVVAAFLGSWNPFEGKDMTISNGQ